MCLGVAASVSTLGQGAKDGYDRMSVALLGHETHNRLITLNIEYDKFAKSIFYINICFDSDLVWRMQLMIIKG